MLSNKLSKTLLALGGVATLGAGWLVVSAGQHVDDGEAPGEESLAVRSGGGPVFQGAVYLAGNEAGRCSFMPGARMAYDVRTDTTVDIDLSQLSKGVELGGPNTDVATSAAQAREVSRTWHIELEAVALENDGVSTLAAHIESRELKVRGEAPVEPSAKLGDTFLIRVEPRCAIREFGWRTEGDLEAAHEQQILAAALGFSAPASDDDEVWGATGFDATGRYDVSYRRTGPTQIHGEVVDFHLSTGVVQGVLPIEMSVLSSNIEVELGTGVWFEKLSSARALDLAFAREPVGGHARSTVATRAAPGRWRAAVDLDDGGWSWGSLLSRPALDEGPSFDETLVAVPVAEALSTYRDMIAEQRSTAEFGGYLQGWLRANPEGAKELVATLRSGGFEGEALARSGVFYALGSAQTPEAAAALLGILDGSGDRRAHKVAAAQALAMVDSPTPDMVELLAEQAESGALHGIERGSMALALGSLANSAADEHPLIAAQARSEIEGWLSAPEDSEQLRHSLLAAGNAGHDELVVSIAPYLDHQDAKVRSSAAHALRQMSPEQAYPALEERLFDDDRSVRTSAIEAATTVCRRHDQAPPRSMVEMAGDSLEGATASEERVLLGLLGEAAQRGDARAKSLLSDRLQAQLHAAERDPQRIAALGRSISGHWKAD